MGDLRDWLTSAGAVTGAVISATILLRMKLGDRKAERNKIVREKLEQVFLMTDRMVANCRCVFTDVGMHAASVAANRKPLESKDRRSKLNRRKLGMLVRIYLPDLTPSWTKFLDAVIAFEKVVYPVMIHLAREKLTKDDLAQHLPKMASTFKSVEAAQELFENVLVEKANTLL